MQDLYSADPIRERVLDRPGYTAVTLQLQLDHAHQDNDNPEVPRSLSRNRLSVRGVKWSDYQNRIESVFPCIDFVSI